MSPLEVRAVQQQSVVPVTYGSPSFRSVSAGGVRVTEAAFAAGSEFEEHVHEHPIVSVLLEGGFDLAVAGRRFDCCVGRAYVEPAGLPHANRIWKTGSRNLILEIDQRIPRDDVPELGALFERPGVLEAPALGGVAGRLAGAVRTPAASTFGIELLTLELLSTAARLRPPAGRDAPAWLERVREILHASIGRPLRVTDLAREAGVHRVHLGRVFHARFGEHLGDYHRRIRVEWAARRIVERDEPMAVVAAAAGFADQSHFVRVFRRVMGITPRRYRLARARRRS